VLGKSKQSQETAGDMFDGKNASICHPDGDGLELSCADTDGPISIPETPIANMKERHHILKLQLLIGIGSKSEVMFDLFMYA